jgi:glycosyltransferase involved in cell wall biosynthesis
MVTSARDKAVKQKGWCMTNEAGIHVHWLPIPYSNKMSYKKRIKAFLKFSFFASLKAASLKGDLIYATSTPLTIAIPAVYASKVNKIPMAFEVRDLWPDGPIAIGAIKNLFLIFLARWLEYFAYHSSAYIVALAPRMKEKIVSKECLKVPIAVIPNGSDLDLFSVEDEVGKQLRAKYDWLQKRHLVVYAGAFGKINGVDYLVRLAEYTRQIAPQVCFIAIGDGREYLNVKKMAKKKGVLGENFFMLGKIPKLDIPAWLSAADLSISLIINQKVFWVNAVTNKFFDALAAGRPIANNHAGWQSELAVQEEVGFILDADDMELAGRQLVSRLDNKEWMQLARKKARGLAEKRFSRDILAKQLENVLLEAVDGYKR